jgi:hypothetical protein
LGKQRRVSWPQLGCNGEERRQGEISLLKLGVRDAKLAAFVDTSFIPQEIEI